MTSGYVHLARVREADPVLLAWLDAVEARHQGVRVCRPVSAARPWVAGYDGERIQWTVARPGLPGFVQALAAALREEVPGEEP